MQCLGEGCAHGVYNEVDRCGFEPGVVCPFFKRDVSVVVGFVFQDSRDYDFEGLAAPPVA